MKGMRSIRVVKLSNSESNRTTENVTIATSITSIRKLVPHRGCWRGLERAFSTVSSSPASHTYTTLCSAPWYSNTRLISFRRDIDQIITRKNDIRMWPSTRLNATVGRTGFRAALSHAHACAHQAELSECP